MQGLITVFPVLLCIFVYTSQAHNRQDECVCTAWGDPHYISFDGFRYDYMGKCKYILAESTDRGSECSFSVSAWNGDHGQRRVSYTDAVEIVIGQNTFTFRRGKQLFVNGQEIRSKSVTEGNNVQVKVCGNWLTLVAGNCGLRAEWDGSMTFKLSLRRGVHGGKVQGLCGNCNGNAGDDFLGRRNADELAATFVVGDGTGGGGAECRVTRVVDKVVVVDKVDNKVVDKVVDKAPPVQPHPCQGDWVTRVRNLKYCGAFLPEAMNPFKQCIERGGIKVDALYQSCRFDVCMNLQNAARVTEIVCESLTSLAAACSEQGFDDISWREKVGCGQKCGPNQVYETKIQPCPASCDSNRQGSTCPQEMIPREGCACKQGFVLFGCECIVKDKCPPNKEVTLTFSRTRSSKTEQTHNLDKGFNESFKEETTYTPSGIPISVKKEGNKGGHHKENKTNKEEKFDKIDFNWKGDGGAFKDGADFMKNFQK